MKKPTMKRRVKQREANVWWFQWVAVWTSVGRMTNDLPPLFDDLGYSWFQPEFRDPRKKELAMSTFRVSVFRDGKAILELAVRAASAQEASDRITKNHPDCWIINRG